MQSHSARLIWTYPTDFVHAICARGSKIGSNAMERNGTQWNEQNEKP